MNFIVVDIMIAEYYPYIFAKFFLKVFLKVLAFASTICMSYAQNISLHELERLFEIIMFLLC